MVRDAHRAARARGRDLVALADVHAGVLRGGEQLARQREQALAGALGQERYSKLILGRDPLYQRARRVATENGIREQATQALYEVFKETQSKRLQIQADRKMTPDQKQDALVAINQEELRRQKKIIDDN